VQFWERKSAGRVSKISQIPAGVGRVFSNSCGCGAGLKFAGVGQNRRQKVSNRGALRLFGGA